MLPVHVAEHNLPVLKSLHTHEEEAGTESQALGNLDQLGSRTHKGIALPWSWSC